MVALAACEVDKSPPATTAGTPSTGVPAGSAGGTTVGVTTTGGSGTTGTGTTTRTTATQTCQAALLPPGYLDALQVPGTVTFCHRGPARAGR